MTASRALLGALFALSISGCACEEDPPECANADDCETGLACADERCVAAIVDAGMDGSAPVDAGPVATSDAGPPPDAGPDAACLPTTCAEDEACFDGFDNDCDDAIDEECGCAPGSTARCLPGGPMAGVARCAFGEMTCEGEGEFGTWGACVVRGGADAGSSLYGCRRIGIMGAPGANPSANFQTWLETQGAIATRFHAAASAPTLQRAELETFDLVIVDWLQRLYTDEEATTLADWVRAGGALMVMTGHDSGATADRHVSLLAQLGPSFDLPAGPLNGPATLLPHPTTADGADTLPPVTFNGGLRTTVPDDLAASIVPMATIGDIVVGVAGPLGEGRVLLFGDEWIEFDSEWSTMPPIPQLWLNVVTWLSPDPELLPRCD